MFKSVLLRLFIRRKKNISSRSRKIVTAGHFFDLQEIYGQLNEEYFGGNLKLYITWSGQLDRPARFKRRLGSFDPNAQLIKIHRLLDNATVPLFFMRFLVYHEMLHCVCPPKKGRKNRWSIHHLEFKKREGKFVDYAMAQEWIKKNSHFIFRIGST